MNTSSAQVPPRITRLTDVELADAIDQFLTGRNSPRHDKLTQEGVDLLIEAMRRLRRVADLYAVLAANDEFHDLVEKTLSERVNK